jgi:hypothetical protein
MRAREDARLIRRANCKATRRRCRSFDVRQRPGHDRDAGGGVFELFVGLILASGCFRRTAERGVERAVAGGQFFIPPRAGKQTLGQAARNSDDSP